MVTTQQVMQGSGHCSPSKETFVNIFGFFTKSKISEDFLQDYDPKSPHYFFFLRILGCWVF